MSFWKKINLSNGKIKIELDIKKLITHLKTISEQGNIEVVRLALQSIIDELSEKE